MSRTLARQLRAIVQLATAPQSAPRAAMTRARLIDLLQQDGTVTIQAKGQELRLLASRGPHFAAAAAQFRAEEPEMLAWIDSFQGGDVFWDIGAAVGMFSMYAALTPGVQVCAFEPKATSLAVLVEHLALNGMGDRVLPLPVAFSDRSGLTRLELATLAPGSGGNSVAGVPDQFGHSHSIFSQATLAYRIDDFRRDFAMPAPTHIKIDVDGAEALILRGAPETLPLVASLMIEVEGLNAAEAATRIEAPLAASGLREVMTVRGAGSGRNRLYRRGG
ncbi:FkbM family methyltransferase [Rhodopila globiformis]|uniref:Methyltransferase FkbM domain-containing protein n=1 Tax=Rhodopila globiformis TaxID=1071 RepID=A0A2S6NNM9_RHOGL|nr:FkbM family methyltransferase [Rhodopila globiformis]PPQ39008.1 hypothetical protein CCS01_01605 [Rhodopila globiformis]